MPATEPIIKIKNMNVTYFAGKSNEVKALQDINLEIFQGQFIIFFGPSGCGKSTLLYSIAGLERNIEGSIMVKGKELTSMKEKDLEAYHQKVIGMIFQSFYLIDSLTIIENVALPQVGIHSDKTERLKKAGALLEKFGVGAQAHKLSHELSGGQQQRVAISRSLINEPDILIADEPVGNLDSKSSQDVMDLLRHLNDNEKKTVILVTHDPSHLRHANKIFYIRDGKITGTKENTDAERNQTIEASMATPISAASMSHWAKAYAPSSEEEKKELNLIQQAQQILTEVLTGMAMQEVQAIEERVQDIMSTKKPVDAEKLVEYLHQSAASGGIGMNLAKARKLAEQIEGIVTEIALLRKKPVASKAKAGTKISAVTARAQELRRFVLQTMDVSLTGPKAVAAMDGAIAGRLEGKMNQAAVQELLDRAVSKGGAGLDIRVARRVARRIELLASNAETSSPSAS